MLNCRQSAELISRGMDARLPLGRRLALRLHVGMCRHCAEYRRQLEQLREVLRRGRAELPELAALGGFRLQQAERERLARILAGE